MSHPEPPPSSLKIVEIDEEGWAAFKKMKGEQRREYSQSQDAVRDHESWVNAPMASDGDWGSMPEEDWIEPVIAPNPNEIPWDQLYDWSLENTVVETNQDFPDHEH